MRRILSSLSMVLVGLWLCGCQTVAVYQSPVAGFQKAVNGANDSIRPYLLGVNSVIAEANLYDKVGLGKDWGTEDLHAGIPPEEIQVRIQALSAIASYANALGAVANANDVDQLAQAAKTLGDDVNGLSATVQGMTAKRASGAGNGPVAKQAATLDLSGPVSSLVTLVGTLVIEQKQKAAVETAILNGDKPVRDLIGLLKTDLQALSLVDDTSYAAKQTAMVKLYNQARSNSEPKGVMALIDDLVQQNNQIQTLRAMQVDSLLSDMANAQAALVIFAKSAKGPKDLSDLAAQINVFTAHVDLFQNAVFSIRTTINSAK